MTENLVRDLEKVLGRECSLSKVENITSRDYDYHLHIKFLHPNEIVEFGNMIMEASSPIDKYQIYFEMQKEMQNAKDT